MLREQQVPVNFALKAALPGQTYLISGSLGFSGHPKTGIMQASD